MQKARDDGEEQKHFREESRQSAVSGSLVVHKNTHAEFALIDSSGLSRVRNGEKEDECN
jgi:hypothetical protein